MIQTKILFLLLHERFFVTYSALKQLTLFVLSFSLHLFKTGAFQFFLGLKFFMSSNVVQGYILTSLI